MLNKRQPAHFLPAALWHWTMFLTSPSFCYLTGEMVWNRDIRGIGENIRKGLPQNNHTHRRSLSKRLTNVFYLLRKTGNIFKLWHFFSSLFKARGTLIYIRCLVSHKYKKHAPLEEHDCIPRRLLSMSIVRAPFIELPNSRVYSTAQGTKMPFCFHLM